MALIPGAEKRERRRFLRHYGEMVLAMIGGMAVFGALVSLFCTVADHEDLLEHPAASAPLMATNMTLGMVLWMRYRRHSWAATGEMAASMYVPTVVLLAAFAVGLLPGDALLGAVHILMLPAMWFVMWRRPNEYLHDHRAVAVAHAH